MNQSASDEDQRPNWLKSWLEIASLALALLVAIGGLVSRFWNKDQGLATVVYLLLLLIVSVVISVRAAKLQRIWLLRTFLLIALLSALGFVASLISYLSPPKDILVLVATFKGPQQQTYQITEALIDELGRELKPYGDIKVERSGMK